MTALYPAPLVAGPGEELREEVDDARSADALRDFCKKMGFEMVDVVTDDPSRPTLAEQLDVQANLDFGLILSCGGSAPAPFELGYCVGRLGLKRVFVLNPAEEKAHFDGHGLLHIPLDPADGWQLHLARQFKRAGLEVDLNRVF